MTRQLCLLHRFLIGAMLLSVPPVPNARGDVGDPQVRTDHPWYPGEFACSTFERLFATQAEVYARVVGTRPVSDEQKALASWLWRNTHYAHGEEGAEDLWGKGFTQGGDARLREYWTGLFAHGFGLCGTTHSQWTAEFETLLGHARGRTVGAAGHNSFEAFLAGGAYGSGKWCLLDHDLCTLVFNDDGTALLSIAEVRRDWKRLTDPRSKTEKQHGWPVCGLHAADGASFSEYNGVEYLAGYAGPPPMVHLRRGETVRRYLRPGLDDGKTFVFWGRNYQTDGIPGPERPLTWVNQPEKLFGSRQSAPYHAGQFRFGNAVFTYRPNFNSSDYQEGMIHESADEVIFEFVSPFVIAATPANDRPWGIYEAGCKNGLRVSGQADCEVSVSTDGGQSWHDGGTLRGGADLTDWVKGHRQYLLKLKTSASALRDSGLSITTICQANPAVMPRLRDGGTDIRFETSGRAVVSAGPALPHALSHVVEGKFGSPRVALELSTPRGESVVAAHAAAHVLSGNPPRSDIRYQIETSGDGGKSWQPLVKDWTITRRGDEPKDFWSQSLCWGSREWSQPWKAPLRFRFSNSGGKSYARAEAHLVYRVARPDPTEVSFSWTDDSGDHLEKHRFGAAHGSSEPVWKLATGKKVQTRWVEFHPDPSGD